MKDYKGCIEDCSKAIEIDPNYPYAYQNRGNAKELMRDDLGACADWKMADELGAEGVKSFIGACN